MLLTTSLQQLAAVLQFSLTPVIQNTISSNARNTSTKANTASTRSFKVKTYAPFAEEGNQTGITIKTKTKQAGATSNEYGRSYYN